MIRAGFVTCVQLGLSCMEEIYRVGGRLDLAVTLPDEKARQKSGRVYLDEFCAAHSIPLLKVAHIDDGACAQAVHDASLDWLFIIGWSQIAGPELLAAPRRGAIGMHPTLLPEGRGRAAIPWAILKGLPETGVTMFQMDAGVDTGPVLAQQRLPLAPAETATTLYARVNEAHRALIANAWPALAAGSIQARPQDDSKATVWPGRKPEDGAIAGCMSVAEVDRLVRAVTRPYPGAFLDCDGGVRITVWSGRPVDPVTTPPGPQLVIRCKDGCYAPVDFELSSRTA
jgi:methionyl-tRNA formyltransferase